MDMIGLSGDGACPQGSIRNFLRHLSLCLKAAT
jgi:hypothetical protein